MYIGAHVSLSGQARDATRINSSSSQPLNIVDLYIHACIQAKAFALTHSM